MFWISRPLYNYVNKTISYCRGINTHGSETFRTDSPNMPHGYSDMEEPVHGGMEEFLQQRSSEQWNPHRIKKRKLGHEFYALSRNTPYGFLQRYKTPGRKHNPQEKALTSKPKKRSLSLDTKGTINYKLNHQEIKFTVH